MDHTGVQTALEAKLHKAGLRLQEAERRVGWLPGLLKRWLNLSVGKQAEVDRARQEVERLESEIGLQWLLHRQPPQPLRRSSDDMSPDPNAVEISTDKLHMPSGRGVAGGVTTQLGVQPRLPPDGPQLPSEEPSDGEGQPPTPNS